MKKFTGLAMFALVTSFFCVACDSDKEGTLAITIWGESYIENEIPPATDAEDGFEDGYKLAYSKFLVVIRDISVEGALNVSESKVWNVHLAAPSDRGTQILSVTAPANDYDHTAYTIAPANSATVAGNASTDDTAFMLDNGYSVYVEGTATAPGKDKKTFAWGFKNSTRFDPCESKGTLKDGGEEFIQITIHGDHLFYDSAISQDAALRFAEVASADKDDDGKITVDELKDLTLDTLAHHDVGSFPIKNMWEYISLMVTTIGHIDGEEECKITPL